MHPCSGYHVDRNYLTETGRMKKGVLGSVSLDRILSNELEELYTSDIFRLCLLVSLKDSRFVFLKRGVILYKTPFYIAHWRGSIADGT